jgi:hypothetical protein
VEGVFSDFLRTKTAGATITGITYLYHHHHHHHYYLTVQLAPAAVEFACKTKKSGTELFLGPNEYW